MDQHLAFLIVYAKAKQTGAGIVFVEETALQKWPKGAFCMTPTDRDGKSKTASAVDSDHYPEQNEVNQKNVEWEPDDDDIAERANQLWHARGCPVGSAEEDWFNAKEQLRAKVNSHNTRKTGNDSGSVQP